MAKKIPTGVVIRIEGAAGLLCNQPLYSGVSYSGIKHILAGCSKVTSIWNLPWCWSCSTAPGFVCNMCLVYLHNLHLTDCCVIYLQSAVMQHKPEGSLNFLCSHRRYGDSTVCMHAEWLSGGGSHLLKQKYQKDVYNNKKIVLWGWDRWVSFLPEGETKKKTSSCVDSWFRWGNLWHGTNLPLEQNVRKDCENALMVAITLITYHSQKQRNQSCTDRIWQIPMKIRKESIFVVW